jgi:tetratricopeptide (TPR) repeat protein
LESGFSELRHNLLLQGTSYMMYFWPAARLSLVAAAGQLGIKDPVGTLMTERSESTKIINAHSYLLRGTQIDEEDMRHAKYALAELQKREILTPDDERLPDTIGLLLLEMNRLNEAETALKRSLSLPLSRGGVRAHTLRNLACVYARMNNESDCRTTLEDAAGIEPLDQKWLTEDRDLEIMRSTDWFKGLTVIRPVD